MSNSVMTAKRPASEAWDEMVSARVEAQQSDTITLGYNRAIHKGNIFKALPILHSAGDDEARMDACLHISYNDPLETEGGKAVIAQLGYKRNASPHDIAIKEMVDACMEITLDGQLVFNDAIIMEKLSPEERHMMVYHMSNLTAFLELRDKDNADELRIQNVIQLSREAPAQHVPSPVTTARFAKPDHTAISRELFNAFDAVGVQPENVVRYMQDAIGALVNPGEKVPKPMFAYKTPIKGGREPEPTA